MEIDVSAKVPSVCFRENFVEDVSLYIKVVLSTRSQLLRDMFNIRSYVFEQALKETQCMTGRTRERVKVSVSA